MRETEIHAPAYRSSLIAHGSRAVLGCAAKIFFTAESLYDFGH